MLLDSESTAVAPGRTPRRTGPADRPVIGYQRWHEILFLHWSVPPDALRPLVDPRLALDLHRGDAWVSLTPFTMRGARLRGLPPMPFLTSFHELNLRTYVRAGGVAGLWFLSLDAASAPASAIARATLGLPYFRARMSRRSSGNGHAFTSERLPPRNRAARFAATWTVGERVPNPPRSLDAFLAERSVLYTTLGGRLFRMRVRHPRWPLAATSVASVEQTVTDAAGLAVGRTPALARFSDGVDVEVFPPEPIG